MASPTPSAETIEPALSKGPAFITIILTLASWTTIPLFLKHFSHLIDAWTANGWRYGISALIWVPALVWAWRAGRWPEHLWRRALVPSFFNAVAQVLFGLAPYYIDPGLMTFSLRVQIVFVTIAAAVLFASERRVIKQPMYLVGIALVVLGTSGTLLFKHGGLGGGTTTGVIMAIASGLLYACYALSVRWFLSGVNPLIAFAAVSQYTAAALVVLMFVFARSLPPDEVTGAVRGVSDYGMSIFSLPVQEQVKLVASALIGIGIGHTLYYYSIARLGIAVAAGVVQLQPVTVSIASMFLFNEMLSGTQWSSGLVAILGAGVILWTQYRVAKEEKAARAK